jgi:hypothetical protein
MRRFPNNKGSSTLQQGVCPQRQEESNTPTPQQQGAVPNQGGSLNPQPRVFPNRDKRLGGEVKRPVRTFWCLNTLNRGLSPFLGVRGPSPTGISDGFTRSCSIGNPRRLTAKRDEG